MANIDLSSPIGLMCSDIPTYFKVAFIDRLFPPIAVISQFVGTVDHIKVKGTTNGNHQHNFSASINTCADLNTLTPK